MKHREIEEIFWLSQQTAATLDLGAVAAPDGPISERRLRHACRRWPMTTGEDPVT
jgi:hypothetical protein